MRLKRYLSNPCNKTYLIQTVVFLTKRTLAHFLVHGFAKYLVHTLVTMFITFFVANSQIY